MLGILNPSSLKAGSRHARQKAAKPAKREWLVDHLL
jgi:hypothetical protein